jgi:hypothetical protein
MSCTELFVFGRDGTTVEEFRNAWGGAVAVWQILGDKYCDDGFDFMDPDPVWRLADGALLTPEERVVLMTTFDGCVVGAEDLGAVADAFQVFYDNNILQRARQAFNIGAQAAALRRLATDTDVVAVAWNQTSVVADSMWLGDWDEVADRYVGYSLETGTKHWYLEVGADPNG